MKHLFLIGLLTTIFCIKISGQQRLQLIKLGDVNKHVKDSVRIFAWVKDVKSFQGPENVMLIIYNKVKASEYITIVIKDEILKSDINFKIKKLKGNYVRVDGIVVKKHGQLVIYINNPSQFLNLSEWEPPPAYK